MRAFLGIPDLERPASAAVHVPAWVDALQRYVPRALTGALLSGFTPTRLAFAAADGSLTGSASLAYGSGTLTIADATASVSPGTGTLVISGAGGIGVGGALWIGGVLNAAGAVTFQTTLGVTGIVTLGSAAHKLDGSVSSTYLKLRSTAASAAGLLFYDSGDTLQTRLLIGPNTFSLRTGADAAMLDVSATTVAVAGALKLGNAYVAVPQVGTGYVILKDSTGTDYKVLVST